MIGLMSRSCEGIAIGPTIGVDIRVGKMTESRPVRARGLKHEALEQRALGGESRPVRARGLKHLPVRLRHLVRQRRAPCGRVD